MAAGALLPTTEAWFSVNIVNLRVLTVLILYCYVCSGFIASVVNKTEQDEYYSNTPSAGVGISQRLNTLAIKSLIQSRGLPSSSCYSPRSPRSAILSPENSHLLDAFLKQSWRLSALESVCEIARYSIPQRRISRPLISARIPFPSKTNFACRRLPDRPVMSPHSGNNPSQRCAALIMFPIRQACLFAKCVREMDDLDVDSGGFVFIFRPELIKDQCAGMFLQQILVSLHGLHQLSTLFLSLRSFPLWLCFQLLPRRRSAPPSPQRAPFTQEMCAF